MPYRTNEVRCVAFSREAFHDEILRMAGAPEGTPPNAQTRYLSKYLETDLSARTLVVERHYIDRHFIEEFSTYYSRCIAPVPNACGRVHAFSALLDSDELDRLIRRAASGDVEGACRDLQSAYLGFVVVRPIPSVPIGRTVLKYPEDLAVRKYESTIEYTVHLFGLELSIRGIAFQQQDVAVAACATTALWTALQRMARHEGGRAPTPSAITGAAARYVLHDGRSLPGRSGLTTDQLCEALRAFEFGPEVVHVSSQPDDFRLTVGIYLRSGIPVILSVTSCAGRALTGHAVTVVGYRQDQASAISYTRKLIVIDPMGHHDTGNVDISLANTAYDRLFIHDDRLGPYASAHLLANAQGGLEVEIKHSNEHVERLAVRHATIPLYPKLRMSAKDLLSDAFDVTPAVPHGSGVSLELYFTRSGSYASSLYLPDKRSRDLDPERLLRFQRVASMSRYVGVARWSVMGTAVFDTIWDTTDIRRKHRYGNSEGLLSIVALHPSYTSFVDRIAEVGGVVAG